MLTGLPFILAMAAQAAVPPAAAAAPPANEAAAPGYGPTLPPKPKPEVIAAAVPTDPCKPVEPKEVKEDTQEIIVCAQRVEGYRIDPDVLAAARAKKSRTHPRRPERLVDNSCQMVGPMGCRGGAGINLIAAAVTAAAMIQKAVSGENVGEMFITDPQPDEYQLYKEAKRAREAKEAEQLAAAKAKVSAGAAAQPAAK